MASPTIQLSCEPCIDRRSYTLRAILHGSSDDPFWQKLAASARQSAIDMRVNLDLQLYEPGVYTEDKMAADIKAVVDSESSGNVNALIVTIPSQVVADAVRYVAGQGMPVFGMNSGLDLVSGRGGLIDQGKVLFFTESNERLGGEMAARFVLRELGLLENDTVFDTPAAEIASPANENDKDTRKLAVEGAEGYSLFISPKGDNNSATYQQRFDGYQDTLVSVTNTTSMPIGVEWFEVDISTEAAIEGVLAEKLSKCNYKSILSASPLLVSSLIDVIEASGCRSDSPMFIGTFDTSSDILSQISEQKLDFAIDPYNHLQGWSPVQFAALYASTGLIMSPPKDSGGVYYAGPKIITQDDSITDTIGKCVSYEIGYIM